MVELGEDGGGKHLHRYIVGSDTMKLNSFEFKLDDTILSS